MKVLGIHIGHDSSAALVIDGKIVADVAEERFTRIKHYNGLPTQAIDYCLASQNLTPSDIDAIAIPAAGPVRELNYLLDLKGGRREPESWARGAVEYVRRRGGRPGTRPPLYVRNFSISPKTEVVHVEHHLAHAASAYFTSGLDAKQLIITVDGVGDGVSVAIWRGENGRIELLEKYGQSGSLGWFYSNVTEALGWWHGDGEGKTMGLAPYGDASTCQGVLDRYAPHYEKGDLVKRHDFGQPFAWFEGGVAQYHFDEAYAIRDLIAKHGREHIAAEAQRLLEVEIGNIVYPWLERERTRNLSAAGGVMLNVKVNQRLWESGRIDNHHTYPNPGDAGLAVGAALYVYHAENPGAPTARIKTLSCGPSYSDDQIEQVIKQRNLEYRRVEDVAGHVADRLVEGKICAWFQGRMESGPRALGGRSILMSAAKPEYKDIINARVKFREPFRPFCPSLLWERKEDYLEKARDEPFMITSFTCRPEKRAAVPAVVHSDATLRPQTVRKADAPLYWDLINKFGSLSGESLVLNTSLNIMGEPIVSHPREAIRCLYDSGIDMLALGNFVLEKKNL